MREKLEKYSNSNIFSLSEFYDGYISSDDYDDILKKYEEEIYRNLKSSMENSSVYESFFKKYNYDEVFNDIKLECELANDRYIADKIFTNQVKYPLAGYIMYHDINSIYTKRGEKDFYINQPVVSNICDILNTSLYEILRNNINRIEIKYNNHCTVGPLFRIYYFNLNDDTKKWLLSRKDIFDFKDGLDDFALYRDDVLLYSTCTHEEYDIDFLD